MPPLRGRWLIPVLTAILVVTVAVAAAQPDDTGQPFPGTRTEYLGFDRYDFEADGQAFTVAVPHHPAPGRPWVWVAEFFGNAFWHGLDADLLARGWHIAYNPSAAGRYGSPRAVSSWNASHAVWTRQFSLDRGPSLPATAAVACSSTTGPRRIPTRSARSTPMRRCAASRAGPAGRARGRAARSTGRSASPRTA